MRYKHSPCCIYCLNRPQYCPEPKTKEEEELQKEEDDKYTRGRIQYAQILSQSSTGV